MYTFKFYKHLCVRQYEKGQSFTKFNILFIALDFLVDNKKEQKKMI